MDKNFLYYQIPFNIYSSEYNNKRNKINIKKNIFYYYNYGNEGKISLIKNIQINDKKEYFPHQLKKKIIYMNRTNNKSLNQKKQSNINNIII